jgi:hypothetical protein
MEKAHKKNRKGDLVFRLMWWRVGLDTEASYGLFWATTATRAACKGPQEKILFGFTISSTLLATADEVIE